MYVCVKRQISMDKKRCQCGVVWVRVHEHMHIQDIMNLGGDGGGDGDGGVMVVHP